MDNNNNYTAKIPVVINRQKNNPNLTLAVVLNDYLYKSLEYECNIISLNRENYYTVLTNPNIDLVIIESPENLTAEWKDLILNILYICYINHIKSAFWDTNGCKFLLSNRNILVLFNYIFTAKSKCVKKYQKVIHDNVYYLPFAIQPRIFNPIEKEIKNKIDELTFNSSININKINNLYEAKINKIYSKKHSLIEANILELLAIGTPLYVSNSACLENLLHKSVLLQDDILKIDADKLSLIGQREVLTHHTYENRIDTILYKTNLFNLTQEVPGVSIITIVDKQDFMDNIFNNYKNQNYENKELIIILNNNELNINEWKQQANSYENVRIFRMDETYSIDVCLNQAVDNSIFPYISIFDNNNYYAPNFLKDLMNAYKYINAEIVGKLTCYCYFEDTHSLTLLLPSMENRYVSMLSNSSMVIKREVFENVKFKNGSFDTITEFLRNCIENGFSLYSADRFNFVCKLNSHKVTDQNLLCQVIEITDDYISKTTV